ncbi:hypothetical protein T10_7999 [Trichinella papuae]|uniref:Uncharacterized protein n=1 Tax=Trichinella papuae TaxID=268474 RepID=A0A0V1MTK6_9BILA|nr:hypothetical protein T10_7999 [Trichinella papuae]
MHTSYNDGRVIAIRETDPPLNNFQFNFAKRKQSAILDYCESTAIANASHDSIYLLERGCLKGRHFYGEKIDIFIVVQINAQAFQCAQLVGRLTCR